MSSIFFTDCVIHNFMTNNTGICSLLISAYNTVFINQSRNDGKIRCINISCLFNEIISKLAQLLFIWNKVFKNGPSKICRRLPLKNEGVWYEYFVPRMSHLFIYLFIYLSFIYLS